MKKFFTTALLAVMTLAGVSAAETLPFERTFNSEENVADFTILDNTAGSITKFSFVTSGGYQPAFRSRYSFSSPKDSWIVTPAIKLENGKEYKVKYTCTGDNGSIEFIDIAVGTKPEISALTIDALTDYRTFGYGNLSKENAFPVEGSFVAPADGDYYIGLRCHQEIGQSMYFFVYDITVNEKAMGDCPADVTDFSAVPDRTGALKTVLTATAPTATLGGAKLTSLTKLEFLRDGEVINTVNNPTPGATYTYTDNAPQNGYRTYGAVASNSEGRGNVVESRVFVGVNAPKAVTDVEAHEISNGKVKLTWVLPYSDVTNTMLDPSLVSCKVLAYDLNGQVSKEFGPFSGTEATVTLDNLGAGQQFLTFGVMAMTSGGNSEVTNSNPVIVGTPDAAPYFESFAGGKPSHAMMCESVKYGANWAFSDRATQDNDGGSAIFSANGIGASANLYTGKISIPAGKRMNLRYYYTAVSNNVTPNFLTLSVSVDGGQFVELETLDVTTSDFQTSMIDLGEYAGKTIQLRWNAECRQGFYVVIDNISIAEAVANDLAVEFVSVPTMIERCVTVPVVVRVKNLGTQSAPSYSVSLNYANNEQVAVLESKGALASGAFQEYEFGIYADKNTESPLTYYAQVTYAADSDQSNNKTGRANVSVETPEFYPAQSVKAVANGNAVTITWATPDGASFSAESPYHRLEGYRVFRDDRAVNSTLTADNEITDNGVPEGEHRYTVVAVYVEGSAPASAAATVNVEESGIETIAIDAISADAVIYDLNGRRVNASTIIPGLYIRVNGAEAAKILVK